MTIIYNFLLLSAAILIVTKIMPTIHIKGIGTVISIALVYSIINVLFGWLLFILALPLIIITFGLFKLIINAFLLWITDKLLDDFRIDGIGSTIIAAVLITVIDSVLKWIL